VKNVRPILQPFRFGGLPPIRNFSTAMTPRTPWLARLRSPTASRTPPHHKVRWGIWAW